jgi:acyl-CoA synthetase (AMP-forming)/AMP-acid ligase II
MAESLAEFFKANFQAHREERAYGQRCGYRMQWFTYGQVLEMAFGFSRELGARGIRKGERVVLWGENCAESVEAFGCALRGAVVVPMDDGASAEWQSRSGARHWKRCTRRRQEEDPEPIACEVQAVVEAL